MDACLHQNSNYFRYRAAAIIIEEKHILMAKSSNTPYYYAIGGGVHLGECAEDAVTREVFEESGLVYKVDTLAVVHENFFTGFMGDPALQCHEVCLYFLMQPHGKRKPLSKPKQLHTKNTEWTEWAEWVPLQDLQNHSFYPTFFKGLDRVDFQNIQHIVTNSQPKQLR